MLAKGPPSYVFLSDDGPQKVTKGARVRVTSDIDTYEGTSRS